MSDGSLDAGALFREHGGFVTRFLSRLGVGAQEMDDHVQEVFLTAHRRGGYRPGPAHPRTWLAEISMRVASTRRRSARRRREDGNPDRMSSIPDAAESPARRLEVSESIARVQRALDSLPLPQRTVFVLYELEGESGAAIAAALGIAENTVYSRLHRARRKFLSAYRDLDAAGSEARPRSEGVAT